MTSRPAAIRTHPLTAPPSVTHQIENGTFKAEGEYGKASQNDLLRKMSRTKPYYKRNRAQICTFWRALPLAARSPVPFSPPFARLTPCSEPRETGN